MQKRLLQINTVINTGSTGRIAEEIGLACKERNWESYIAYGRNLRPSQSKLIRIGSDWEVNMHVLRTRITDRHGFGSKDATYKLIDTIRLINPHIIHLHNIHGYYINIELLFTYLSQTSVPVVWTLHDCWPFTGHCYHFEFIGCEKWKTNCYDCPQKKLYPASYVCDASTHNFKDKMRLFTSLKNTMLVPVSDWLENLLNESFLRNLPRNRIYNGINLEDFYPQGDSLELKKQYGIENKFLAIGVASNWKVRKGLEDFIRLSKLVDNDVAFILIGVDKKEQKKLPANIIGLQRTENISQLAKLYTTADLFLNLTYEDNFPSTNLEAMACGTPVLTYNTGGSPEAVTNETGFVVQQGDLQTVCKIIKYLKTDSKLKYTQSCRRHVENYFNKNDRFSDYIDLYENIL